MTPLPHPMRRAVIFVNGLIEDYPEMAASLREGDYLIGADGGTRHCLAVGRDPHVVVGDLDSLDSTLVEGLESRGVQFERHPASKDQTDLELAIERAIRDGAQEIVLLGAMGGRLDQTLANILILGQRKWSVPIRLVEGKETAQVLYEGDRLCLHTPAGSTVSIIPLTPEVTGVTYRGMRYPLEKATLHFGSTRGISNVVEQSPASIEIEMGMLLVLHSGAG